MRNSSKLNNILISIVIPCYNDGMYVEKTINSALNQTYPYKEIIVVDDGSDEKTKKKLKELEPKIKCLLFQKNRGQSRARNVGIEKAQGDYVLVLDSDDFFEPTFCEGAVKVLEINKDVKLVSCQVRRINSKGVEELFIPHGGRIGDFLKSNGVMGSCMFRKEDWASCGGYDESMINGFEDWEFYIRMLRDGGESYILPEILFNYRIRSDSTSVRANKRKYELQKYIYLKHKELYKEYFEEFVDHSLNRIKREEKEKIKNTQRIEYRIGKAILAPLRRIKSWIM